MSGATDIDARVDCDLTHDGEPGWLREPVPKSGSHQALKDGPTPPTRQTLDTNGFEGYLRSASSDANADSPDLVADSPESPASGVDQVASSSADEADSTIDDRGAAKGEPSSRPRRSLNDAFRLDISDCDVTHTLRKRRKVLGNTPTGSSHKVPEQVLSEGSIAPDSGDTNEKLKSKIDMRVVNNKTQAPKDSEVSGVPPTGASVDTHSTGSSSRRVEKADRRTIQSAVQSSMRSSVTSSPKKAPHVLSRDTEEREAVRIHNSGEMDADSAAGSGDHIPAHSGTMLDTPSTQEDKTEATTTNTDNTSEGNEIRLVIPRNELREMQTLLKVYQRRLERVSDKVVPITSYNGKSIEEVRELEMRNSQRRLELIEINQACEAVLDTSQKGYGCDTEVCNTEEEVSKLSNLPPSEFLERLCPSVINLKEHVASDYQKLQVGADDLKLNICAKCSLSTFGAKCSQIVTYTATVELGKILLRQMALTSMYVDLGKLTDLLSKEAGSVHADCAIDGQASGDDTIGLENDADNDTDNGSEADSEDDAWDSDPEMLGQRIPDASTRKSENDLSQSGTVRDNRGRFVRNSHGPEMPRRSELDTSGMLDGSDEDTGATSNCEAEKSTRTGPISTKTPSDRDRSVLKYLLTDTEGEKREIASKIGTRGYGAILRLKDFMEKDESGAFDRFGASSTADERDAAAREIIELFRNDKTGFLNKESSAPVGDALFVKFNIRKYGLSGRGYRMDVKEWRVHFRDLWKKKSEVSQSRV